MSKSYTIDQLRAAIASVPGDFKVKVLVGDPVNGRLVDVAGVGETAAFGLFKLLLVDPKRAKPERSRKTTWSDGDEIGGVPCVAGLFAYSGFGLGHYHSKTGDVYWVEATRAAALAKNEGAEFKYVDVGG